MGDVMTRSVQTLPLELTLADTLEKFQDGHSAFPIAEGEILRGYRQFAGAFQRAESRSAFLTPVRDFM